MALRTFKNGHTYYKTSDCPSCPVCENKRKPDDNFLSHLAAPARRALENEGIYTVEQLTAYSETQLLQLHGLGKRTLPKLKQLLAEKDLTFKAG
jgi:DNA-directed RNA polymerase alpha subunit